MNFNQRTLSWTRNSLLVLCALSVGLTAYELVRPYGLSPGAAPVDRDEPARIEANIVDVEVIPPIDAFSAIIDRPLFMENRKPFVPPPVPVKAKKPKRPRPAAPDILEQVLLSAVVLTKHKRIALIQIDRNKKLQKLMQGEKLHGWTLTSIQSGGISVQRGSKTRHIALTVKPSRPGAQEKQVKNSADAKTQVKIKQADESPEDGADSG